MAIPGDGGAGLRGVPCRQDMIVAIEVGSHSAVVDDVEQLRAHAPSHISTCLGAWMLHHCMDMVLQPRENRVLSRTPHLLTNCQMTRTAR